MIEEPACNSGNWISPKPVRGPELSKRKSLLILESLHARRFNVLDKMDGFIIKGTILNFPAEQLKPFTKPYMNVDVEGMLDEVYFNFAGNDMKSKGNFAIKYEDLNVTVYKKNSRKEKNKFLILNKNESAKVDLSIYEELNLKGKKFKNILTGEEIIWDKELTLNKKGAYLFTTKMN